MRDRSGELRGKDITTSALVRSSSIHIAAVADAVNRDGVGGLIEQHAVVGDTKPKQPLELAAEGLDPSSAGFRVVVDRFQYLQSGTLLDGADFFSDIRPKADFLHAIF
jgi:hypothetical protein